MSATFDDFLKSSIPANKFLLDKLGLVKGIVASKVIYASNLKDRVCRFSISTMAQELGVDKATISRALEKLTQDKYIERIKEATATEPAHYAPLEKLIDLIPEGVAESNTTVAQSNPSVAESNQDKELNKTKKKKIKEATPPPPSVETYRTVAKRYPDKATWPIIELTVGSEPDNLAFWEQIIRAYIGCGWNKLNVTAMLDFYRRRVLPSTKPKEQNGRQPGNGTTLVTNKDAEAIRKALAKRSRSAQGAGDTAGNAPVR